MFRSSSSACPSQDACGCLCVSRCKIYICTYMYMERERERERERECALRCHILGLFFCPASFSHILSQASYFIRLPMRDSRLKHSAQALGGALLLNLVVRKSHENSSSSDERGPAAAGANDTLAHEDSILASSMTYIDYTMGTALRQVNMTFLMQLLPPQRYTSRSTNDQHVSLFAFIQGEKPWIFKPGVCSAEKRGGSGD